MLADLFAATSLCPASVVTWAAQAAETLGSAIEHIATRVAQAAVRHLDETDFRVGGKTCWLHNASTALHPVPGQPQAWRCAQNL